MKYAAILLNAGLLIFGGILIIPNFLDINGFVEFIVAFLIVIVPVINIYCLLGIKLPDSWLTLYYANKKLEELARIEKLKNEKQ